MFESFLFHLHVKEIWVHERTSSLLLVLWAEYDRETLLTGIETLKFSNFEGLQHRRGVAISKSACCFFYDGRY